MRVSNPPRARIPSLPSNSPSMFDVLDKMGQQDEQSRKAAQGLHMGQAGWGGDGHGLLWRKLGADTSLGGYENYK